MNDLSKSISEDAPFGVFLKGDKTKYRALRTAFNSAQASWRSLSETPEALLDRDKAAANSAAWASLAELCKTCLKDTSKDLEVLSWHVASQVHGSKPFENCRDALSLLDELTASNIEALQPIPPTEKLKGETDEARAREIAELKLRSFIQLFGEVEGTGLLTGPITNLPLVGEVSFGKYVLANKAGSLDDLRSEVATHIASESDALTLKIEGLQQMVVSIENLETNVKKFASEHGQTAPLIGYGVRLMKDVLAAIEVLVEGLGFIWPGVQADEAVENIPQEQDAADTNTVANQATQGSNFGAVGSFSANANVANRNDALIAIAQLAKYFRKTEPHSPICLLLDRAVRWGNLNAAELYREILSEGSVGMSQMALMTGLESQGFSDNFERKGGVAAGGVEHPQLDNYSAALPKPTVPVQTDAQMEQQEYTPLDVANIQASMQSSSDILPASSSAEVEESPPAPAENTENLPVEDFEW